MTPEPQQPHEGFSVRPPDYILAMPEEEEVPIIMGSCDKCDLEELKEFRRRGMYIYKLVKNP
jgi:hypothetical protein